MPTLSLFNTESEAAGLLVPLAAVPDEAFSASVFAVPLDFEAHLAHVPEDVTCKGMYFRDTIAAARRMRPDLEAKLPDPTRYTAFKDYPLAEHMRLTRDLVTLVMPRLPSAEAMRRLGWQAYPSFRYSMVGRVMFGMFGEDLAKIYGTSSKAIEVSLSRGRLEHVQLGPRHHRLRMEDIYGYLSTYYVGVIEGPCIELGQQPRVRVALRSLSSGDFDLQW